MKDNIIKFFILLSVISYLGAGIWFLFNQNFQNWGFGSLLIIGLLVMIVEFIKIPKIFNKFTILDSYQKLILEILIWVSPLLFMIYYSFYSSDFKISGMLGNLAGGVLLTGLLIMIVEVTTFLSKQKPRIVASLVNGIYKMLFFLKDKGYYEEIHKLSGEINDLLGDKINKNLKIDLIPKENSQENFVTHAKSYLNFAYFCGTVLFDEKLEDISRLRFENLDLTEQKKEIFEKLKEYKDKLGSKNKDDLDKIKSECQKIIDKIFDDDEFQKTLFELANNFMDNDSMLSIREKRQIQNILFLKNANIVENNGEDIKNTFQFILGFYLIFDYYLDKLAYYGEDIKENIERKEDKKTSNVIMKFIDSLKHFVTNDSYWRTKINEIGIYLGIGLVLLVMCCFWYRNQINEFWKSISENIIYGISGLIITILVLLKDELIPSKKSILATDIKNLPIWKNLNTKLSLDENFKNFETYFDSDFFKKEFSYFYYFIEENYDKLKELFINTENNLEKIIQEFKPFDELLGKTEELITPFSKEFNKINTDILSETMEFHNHIKNIIPTSYDLPFSIDSIKKFYISIYEKNSMKFSAVTGFMGGLLLDTNSFNDFINKNLSNFFSTVSILKTSAEISTRRYNQLRSKLKKKIDPSEDQKEREIFNELIDSLDNSYKTLKECIDEREKYFSKILEFYPEIIKIKSKFKIFYNDSMGKLSPIINMNVINSVIDTKSNLLDRGFFSQDTNEFYVIIYMLNNDIYFSYKLSFIKEDSIKSFGSLLLLSSLAGEGNLRNLATDLLIKLNTNVQKDTVGYDIGLLPLIESFEENKISLNKMLSLDCVNGFRKMSDLTKEKGSGLTKEEFNTLFEEEIKKNFLSDDYESLFGNSIEFKEKMSVELNDDSILNFMNDFITDGMPDEAKEELNEIGLVAELKKNIRKINPEDVMNDLANDLGIRSLQETMGVSKEELDKIIETFKEKLRTSYNN